VKIILVLVFLAVGIYLFCVGRSGGLSEQEGDRKPDANTAQD